LSILFLSILILTFRPARRLRRAGVLRQTVLSQQAGPTRGIFAQIIPVRIGLT